MEIRLLEEPFPFKNLIYIWLHTYIIPINSHSQSFRACEALRSIGGEMNIINGTKAPRVDALAPFRRR